jgi:hypothetical protein
MCVRERVKTIEMEEQGDRTILGKILQTVDPETGEKLSEADIITNANLLVYKFLCSH